MSHSKTLWHADKRGCAATGKKPKWMRQKGRLSASAMTSSILMTLGVLCSGGLIGCGDDGTYYEIGNETVEQVSQIVAQPASAILYSNVDFKVTDYTVPQSCAPSACVYGYSPGKIESMVLYPGCQAFFWEENHIAKTYTADSGRPYYVSSLSHKNDRANWMVVSTGCTGKHGPVLSHDAMAWSEAGQTGERLPLFVGQDWYYPNWFRNKVSSFQVVDGNYMVVYIGVGEEMATSLIEFANLGNPLINIDNQVTRTEVRPYVRHQGEVGCATPRGCYPGSETCSSAPTYISDTYAGLQTCQGIQGRSYCTGQYRCVDAETGEPKVVSQDEGK